MTWQINGVPQEKSEELQHDIVEMTKEAMQRYQTVYKESVEEFTCYGMQEQDKKWRAYVCINMRTLSILATTPIFDVLERWVSDSIRGAMTRFQRVNNQHISFYISRDWRRSEKGQVFRMLSYSWHTEYS